MSSLTAARGYRRCSSRNIVWTAQRDQHNRRGRHNSTTTLPPLAQFVINNNNNININNNKMEEREKAPIKSKVKSKSTQTQSLLEGSDNYDYTVRPECRLRDL